MFERYPDDSSTARLFAEVEHEVGGHIRPAGAQAAIVLVRRRRRRNRAAVGLLALVLLAGLTLGDTLTRKDSGTTPGGSTDPAVVWDEFVACARAHGQPDFPHPRLDPNGSVNFPDGFDVHSAFAAVDKDCGPILDRLPPKARLSQPGR